MRTSLMTLLALTMGLPVAQAQVEEQSLANNRWSLSIIGQHLYDARYTSMDDPSNGDTGEDMYGLHGKSALDLGLGLRAKYSATPMLSLDASWTRGTMSGANQVEYYRSDVDFLMVGANYALRPSNQNGLCRWVPYARFALGAGLYDATRYFNLDDVAVASTNGMTLASDLGLGFSYYLSDRFSLNAESVWTSVATDAWDGYNYGTGPDQLIRTSVGISYTLGKGVNLDRTPGFKDGRLAGLMDAYEELQSAATKLSYDLNQVNKALLASESRSASRQDSVVKALLANVEMRFAEAQKVKESKQNIGTVYFAFDRSELNSEALEFLKQVASELRADSDRKVEVQAFSDEVGSAASNERIRRRRERAVVEFLLANGVRKSQVEALPWNGSYSGVDTHDRRAEVKRLY